MTRLILFLIVTALSAAGQGWPQWRGPARDGVIPTALPAAWPEKLNQLWKVTAGEGHSSPVGADQRVYLHTRVEENEVVSCFDLPSGKVLWKAEYPAPYTLNPAARAHGKGPKSTPLLTGGRLFTYGINGILSSFDAATGKLIWRKDFGSQFKLGAPRFGSAVSPLLEGGNLIVHVGGHDSGALTAFDPATGAVRWEWKGDGPGYASAMACTLGGKRQIVTQTQQQIVSVDAATGALLWSLPFTTPYVQNIVTPLLWKDLLILSGLQNPTFAVRVRESGGRWSAERVWQSDETSMYMNSPVPAGDKLVGFTNRTNGALFLLDPATGKTISMGEGRQGDNAAITAAGSTVLVLTTEALLEVHRVTPKGLEKLRSYTVANSPVWAHPAVTPRGVLIKDKDSLAFWQW